MLTTYSMRVGSGSTGGVLFVAAEVAVVLGVVNKK
jgi:hypothetical protein